MFPHTDSHYVSPLDQHPGRLGSDGVDYLSGLNKYNMEHYGVHGGDLEDHDRDRDDRHLSNHLPNHQYANEQNQHEYLSNHHDHLSSRHDDQYNSHTQYNSSQCGPSVSGMQTGMQNEIQNDLLPQEERFGCLEFYCRLRPVPGCGSGSSLAEVMAMSGGGGMSDSMLMNSSMLAGLHSSRFSVTEDARRRM
jgi:hypothetical protein